MLRDFLYLDIDKISSIYSQLTGGLVTATEHTTGTEKDERNIRRYDLKIFTPEFGGAETTTSRLVETRVMHHDLFNRMEEALFKQGYALDVNKALSPKDLDSGAAHERLSNAFYIKCTGWPIFEDYEKIKFVSQNYNEVVKWVRQSALMILRQSDEYMQITEKIRQLKSDVQAETDRNKKALLRKKVEDFEKTMSQKLESSTGVVDVEQWIIDGLRTWIDTFLKGAVFAHIYPFEDFARFRVKANLKPDCFIDGSPRIVDSCYSSRPTVKLTLFGLVTSVPSQGEHPFDPMKEYEGQVAEGQTNDPIAFEKALRGVFRGFDGIERLIKFDRYPSVTVYPLAVFRDIVLPDKSDTKRIVLVDK
jgi:hypothetical protein